MPARFHSVIAGAALLVLALLLAPTANAASHAVFHVGHSLTDNPLPDFIAEGATQSGNGYSYGYQIRWGNPVISNWQNHAAPDKGVDSFPALGGGTYDTFVLCPGPGVLEQYFVQTDPTYAAKFLHLAITGQDPDSAATYGAGNANVQTYVYGLWPGNSGSDESWYDGLVAARAQVEAIADTMSGAEPGARTVRIIPVAYALGELFARAAAGQVPGFSKRADFFVDGIHLNPTGVYCSAMVHLAAIYGVDPTTLPAAGGPAGIDPGVRALIREVAWKAASTYPRSGIAASDRAPVLLFQTGERSVFRTQATTFAVTATGYPEPTYQWRRNGAPIGGATARSYTIVPTLSDDGARFDCVIGNRAGSLTSASAQLIVDQIPATVYLSDLTFDSASTGYGPVHRDESCAGTTQTIAGQTFAKGLATQDPSTIVYTLGGNYTRFQASIGVDDMDASGSTVFVVKRDGVVAYTSPALDANASAVAIDLDVSGTTTLELDMGIAAGVIHGDWAEAMLTHPASLDPMPPPGYPFRNSGATTSAAAGGSSQRKCGLGAGGSAALIALALAATRRRRILSSSSPTAHDGGSATRRAG